MSTNGVGAESVVVQLVCVETKMADKRTTCPVMTSYTSRPRSMSDGFLALAEVLACAVAVSAVANAAMHRERPHRATPVSMTSSVRAELSGGSDEAADCARLHHDKRVVTSSKQSWNCF
jgi:hypothetical protein